jgi:GTPase Era involved in 16S rRNA processing
LETDYPTQLLLNSDITILICRANRLWEKADDNILNNLKQLLTSDLRFVINGVDIKEVESLLGELPHKKSPFRGLFRNVFNFQFRVNQHI